MPHAPQCSCSLGCRYQCISFLHSSLCHCVTEMEGLGLRHISEVQWIQRCSFCCMVPVAYRGTKKWFQGYIVEHLRAWSLWQSLQRGETVLSHRAFDSFLAILAGALISWRRRLLQDYGVWQLVVLTWSHQLQLQDCGREFYSSWAASIWSSARDHGENSTKVVHIHVLHLQRKISSNPWTTPCFWGV